MRNGLLDFSGIQTRLDAYRRSERYLLGGNGLSQAADSIFGYGVLYDLAVKDGRIGKELRAVFEKLGTSDFEEVMCHVAKPEWQLRHPGNQHVYELIEALLTTILEHHVSHGAIESARFEACRRFMLLFGSVGTLSYDLLLYWASCHRGWFRDDGFGWAEDPAGDDEECRTLFYQPGRHLAIAWLHGGVHLYYRRDMEKDVVGKHRADWRYYQTVRDQVKTLADVSKPPLIVAGNDAAQKRRQIERRAYLRDAWNHLSHQSGVMVVFGCSFGASDAHVLDAIASSSVREVFVGIYGDPLSPQNQATILKAKSLVILRERLRPECPPLAVELFDSGTARVWGGPPSPPRPAQESDVISAP